MSRNYVLDTNVLLFDPSALRNFEEHDITVPCTVIEEIDKFKRDPGDTGRNAREASRILDGYRKEGSLSEGVPLLGGGSLRVLLPDDVPSEPFAPTSNDNLILNLVVQLMGRGQEVVLVSRDMNMRIKADAAKIPCEDYRNSHVVEDLEDQFQGWRKQFTDSSVIDTLASGGELQDSRCLGKPNECLILTDGLQKSLLARVSSDSKSVKAISTKVNCWGISPKNKEQCFALNLLMDPEVQLVTLQGVAGTGKTLLAIAAAMAQVCDEDTYRKALVARPVMPMGKGIGFLPGTLAEKLDPWMQPIYDNLELLVGGSGKREGEGNQKYQYLFDRGHISVEALSYIRGRSIPGQFLIINEAQNLTPHEAKTILTRAGKGTKIVLTGDPDQIDNPYVDSTSNGLTYVIERFKDNNLAGHVTLTKGERSPLAEVASVLL